MSGQQYTGITTLLQDYLIVPIFSPTTFPLRYAPGIPLKNTGRVLRDRPTLAPSGVLREGGEKS